MAYNGYVQWLTHPNQPTCRVDDTSLEHAIVGLPPGSVDPDVYISIDSLTVLQTSVVFVHLRAQCL